MSRRRPARASCRPRAEALEDRSLLSVAFQIDYQYDSSHFFDTQAKRDLLQAAADTIGSRLGDDLSAIQPGAGNSWSADFLAPGTGAPTSVVDLAIPANTILIYAGARPLVGSEIGVGGFGGFHSSGSSEWNALLRTRGQAGSAAAVPTDFGPWGGTIAFDSNASWYFGRDLSGLKSDQNDFLSVAFHELEHLIGFGTSPSWNALVSSTGQFLGPASNAVFDGPGVLSVSPDGGHWASGTSDGGSETVMDPTLSLGTRKLPTRLDYAGLQDIGWTLSTDPDGSISPSAPAALAGPGQTTLLGLALGPDDRSDVDMFKIVGSAGQVFTASTLAGLGGTPVDTYLRLFDASGRERKSANDGVYDTLSFKLPADGTYYLGVSAAGNVAYSPLDDLTHRLAGPTGDYDLSLRLDPSSGGATADLVVQVAAPPTAFLGVPLVYTASVLNAGPDSAGAVRLVETLPPSVTFVSAISSGRGPVTVAGGVLTAEFGTLPAGASGTVQITVIPNAATGVALTLAAADQQVDPTPANNTASALAIVSVRPVPPPAPAPADTTPPTVAGKTRILISGKRAKRTTSFSISFSEAVVPGQAQDLGNFLLTRPGRARRHRPIPRIAVKLRSASYDPGSHTVTLVPAARGKLPRGLLLTIVQGSPGGGMHDLAGNAMVGDAVLAIS